ncbi:uncharacterized protein HMPREF1541_05208 [Cyphellophora europaea CBS 101466]|uniref:Zn(2)-C6 fungal-type domain-containing protein n=1 Tax=Cyphellophora europaea (strain CBS 101466) TaxID=1220924 RepID=W2RYU2_CYPE1|nr:uncharacterized protein HMPREF1541_05208 [Cyphellophora europaea CBS 101466]ETN40928.1 hypothetical protein HMPREF1541_05208 [Cyphellophora europaea CBS 101466]
MPRRTHKKSRTGCGECKKRHIKCDEHRPRCVNCVTAASSCSFEYTTPASYSSGHITRAPSASSRQLDGSTPATPSDASGSRPVQAFNTNLNLDHLELFHHFLMDTANTMADEVHQRECYKTIVIREAMAYPFLMYQILAVAALHIATGLPSDRADHYYHRATELQSAAMAGFKIHEARVDKKSAFAQMLFSVLVGLHVIADRSRTRGLDHHGFMQHFVHCVRLMQGVRVLVVDDWWEEIRSRPEFSPISQTPSLGPPYDVPPQLERLKDLIGNTARLGPEPVAAYTKAVDHLHWLFAITGVPHRSYETVRLVLAWPIRSSSEYLTLVEQRRPEALIILAHYALALHFYRGSWVISDSGIRLLNAIDAELNPDWSSWLDWPRELVSSAGTLQDARQDTNMTNMQILDPQLEYATT